ncbi:transporter substrate-binding domain-containing protein [Burkholderiaceae bacterium DAT-1]|nr:transporter substrate-binding domain-containing protein [Burkholderiaceae bacterium DAT-1]
MRVNRYLHLPLITTLLMVAKVCAGEMVLYAEHAVPNNYLGADGKTAKGIAVDRLRAAFKKTGIPYSITITEWSRAFKLAQRQSNACVFSTARLPEREAMFQWVGPIASSSWVLWGRPDQLPPESLESVREKLICALLNDGPGEYLQARGFRIVGATAPETCARNVARGVADYWANSLTDGQSVLTQLQLSDQVEPKYEYRRNQLYLACNLAMPKHQIDRLQNALPHIVYQSIR